VSLNIDWFNAGVQCFPQAPDGCGMRRLMRGKGNCWGNAPAQSL
jgi:hypothetical protein